MSKKGKKYTFIAFALGAMSVFLVLLINFVGDLVPQLDVFNLVAQTNLSAKQKFLALFLFIAVVEEIGKFLVVLYIDKSTKLINSIHEAIRYSVAAALGFAFAENIHYFYSFGFEIALYQFLALFTFRSIITVCGHLTFSGIFGNYYGMSKFSKSFATQEHWGDLKKMDKRAMDDKVLVKRASKFQKLTIAKGLLFAVILHTGFNFFLEQGMITNVLWLIGIGLVFLIYLYRRRSGYISLIYRRSKIAHMKARDKDVVLELLGTWYKEGKYIKVIETSKRLLKKDPNNPVVQLFLHKAVDNQQFIDAYSAFRKLFVRTDYLKDFYEEDEG